MPVGLDNGNAQEFVQVDNGRPSEPSKAMTLCGSLPTLNDSKSVNRQLTG
jgi:hypothetical protein